MCRIFQKIPLSAFYILVLFSLKHPILDALLVKNQPNHFKPFFENKQKKKTLLTMQLTYEFEKV